jgi:hypothetical protein
VISAFISRTSALWLGIAGFVLLFSPDAVLPRLISGYPSSGLWLGQLLGAAWLGLAALNWINRRLILGGVFGRPIVLANAIHYFISAMVLIRAVIRQPEASVELAAIPAIALAVAYGALLFRGPFDQPR